MEPNITANMHIYTICNKYKFYEILLRGFRGVVLTGTGFTKFTRGTTWKHNSFFNDSHLQITILFEPISNHYTVYIDQNDS